MTPSPSSVCWARRTRGSRNSGTAFAIASTPVSADEPEANALSSSSSPTEATDDTCPCGKGSGWVRSRPPMMTAKIPAMNKMVGAINSRADSATPHRFAAVIAPRTARHSQTRSGYRFRNADVSASTPADTPTAALST